jgi:hypothetical protein
MDDTGDKKEKRQQQVDDGGLCVVRFEIDRQGRDKEAQDDE